MPKFILILMIGSFPTEDIRLLSFETRDQCVTAARLAAMSAASPRVVICYDVEADMATDKMGG